MSFCTLREAVTVQGNVRLALWRNNEIVEEQIITNADSLNSAWGFWDGKQIVYMYAAPDGYLHIDFEID